ncbi:hypothetical protein MUP05_06405 [Candidatus Bathyarchaeota archaeon]|nr:hypothetical protein [Candidatus Bathyarchaeota archaeon]
MSYVLEERLEQILARLDRIIDTLKPDRIYDLDSVVLRLDEIVARLGRRRPDTSDNELLVDLEPMMMYVLEQTVGTTLDSIRDTLDTIADTLDKVLAKSKCQR